MNYKQHLLANYDTLYKVKNMLDSFDRNYFTTTIINSHECDSNTISIVMTACNRSVQTYFTLDTIAKSSYKNVQIIIIDDSTSDYVLIENLQHYNLHIELINIKNKFWVNPCVNYNIGFKHIKGGRVIIQNAEVCYIKGDILSYTINIIKNDEYHSFDVFALNDIEQNKLLYKNNNINGLKGIWYQHHIHNNRFYHFLVAMTIDTFNKIGGFDIDYSIGVDYDDNALVRRVKNRGIKLVNVQNLYMGVHQWHGQTGCGSHSKNINNEPLWHCKNDYYDRHNIFLDLTTFPKDAVSSIIDNLF